MTTFTLISDTSLRADMIDSLHQLTLGATPERTQELVEAFKRLWDGAMWYDEASACFCRDGLRLTPPEQELLDHTMGADARREAAEAAAAFAEHSDSEYAYYAYRRQVWSDYIELRRQDLYGE